MIVLRELLSVLAPLIWHILTLYEKLLIGAIIVSWLTAFDILNRGNRLVDGVCDFLRAVSEPYFKFFRRFFKPVGNVDFSPILAFVALYFVKNFVPNLLIAFANAL